MYVLSVLMQDVKGTGFSKECGMGNLENIKQDPKEIV
jgi:hypothetical protein